MIYIHVFVYIYIYILVKCIYLTGNDHLTAGVALAGARRDLDNCMYVHIYIYIHKHT